MLINQYQPGAGIGWHRDKAQFDEVTAVSLLAPCNLRFRRKSGESWERASLTVEPRSAYLLSGPARSDVGAQHSGPRPASLFDHLADAGLRALRIILKRAQGASEGRSMGATGAHWSILRDAMPRDLRRGSAFRSRSL